MRLREQKPLLILSLSLSILSLSVLLLGCTQPSLGSGSDPESASPKPVSPESTSSEPTRSSSELPDQTSDFSSHSSHSSSTVSPSPETPSSKTPGEKLDVSSGAQRLPISAQVILGGETVDLEVAVTPRQQAIGLMFRPTIPDNQGMLFPFEPPRPVNFWMRNVQVPLDMVFIRQGVIVAIAHSVPPCTTRVCPTYGPDAAVDYVMELRGGRAEELGLSVGNAIDIQFLEATRPTSP